MLYEHLLALKHSTHPFNEKPKVARNQRDELKKKTKSINLLPPISECSAVPHV